MTIKVAINGYGTIGKRVADAVACQDDMEIIGVTKTRPAFGCDLAVRKGYPLYCTFDDEQKIAAFAGAGYQCHGGLSDLLSAAEIRTDLREAPSLSAGSVSKVSCLQSSGIYEPLRSKGSPH